VAGLSNVGEHRESGAHEKGDDGRRRWGCRPVERRRAKDDAATVRLGKRGGGQGIKDKKIPNKDEEGKELEREDPIRSEQSSQMKRRKKLNAQRKRSALILSPLKVQRTRQSRPLKTHQEKEDLPHL